MNQYVYSFIPAHKKQLYQTISNALDQGKNAIDLLTAGSMNTILEVVSQCLLDVPEVFWLQSMVSVQGGMFGKKLIISRFALPLPQDQMQKQLKQKLLAIMSDPALTSCTNDAMRLQYVFRYLQQQTQYDHEEVRTRNHPLSHTAYGSVVMGLSVCDGNTKGAIMMCRHLGIPCMGVLGTMNGEEHAWLMVQCDGAWFHMDPSDQFLYNGQLDFRYWLRSDSEVSKTHCWERSAYPVCNTSNTYCSVLSQKQQSNSQTSSPKQQTVACISEEPRLRVGNMMEYQKILREHLGISSGKLLFQFDLSFGPIREELLIRLFQRIAQDCRQGEYSYTYQIQKKERCFMISWE